MDLCGVGLCTFQCLPPPTPAILAQAAAIKTYHASVHLEGKDVPFAS